MSKLFINVEGNLIRKSQILRVVQKRIVPNPASQPFYVVHKRELVLQDGYRLETGLTSEQIHELLTEET